MTNQRYTRPAMILHGLMALLIVFLLGVGWFMVDMPLSPSKFQIYSYHKWAGMIVLFLWFIRVAWRFSHKPPEALPAPVWQQWAAHIVHSLLYLGMLAMPLTGWLMSSAKGFPVVLFGLIPIPNLISPNPELGEFFAMAHGRIAIVLSVLIVIHLLAALKHHFVDKDATLSRIMPIGK